MPPAIVQRAGKILVQLESENRQGSIAKPTQQISQSREGMQLSFFQLEDPVLEQIRSEICNIDVKA